MDNIYKDTRNYSHELSINAEVAENKLSYDIPSYLKKLEKQFADIGLLDIHTSYHAEELQNSLSISQTKHIYFLLKECFSNTIKHTSAQNIWVSIQLSKEECIIYFIDDGKGYNEVISEGVGIGNMRQRAEELNGTFEIKADIEGTTVKVLFLINNPTTTI